MISHDNEVHHYEVLCSSVHVHGKMAFCCCRPAQYNALTRHVNHHGVRAALCAAAASAAACDVPQLVLGRILKFFRSTAPGKCW
jgi:hypothetical protein